MPQGYQQLLQDFQDPKQRLLFEELQRRFSGGGIMGAAARRSAPMALGQGMDQDLPSQFAGQGRQAPGVPSDVAQYIQKLPRLSRPQPQPATQETVSSFDETAPQAIDEHRQRLQQSRTMSDQDQRRSRMGQLRGLTDIAEGLGNINVPIYAYTPKGVIGPQKKEPYVAEGLRSEMNRVEDTLTPEERSKLGGVLGIDSLPEGLTFSRLSEIAGPLSSTLRATANRDAVNARTQGRLETADRTRLEGAFSKERGAAIGDKSYSSAKKGVTAAQNAIQLLELNDNPQAIRSAIIALARASGDTGVLSNQDIAGWEGKIGIPGFFNITLPKVVTGNYSPEQVENLKEAATAMGQENQRVLQETGEMRMKSFFAANSDLLGRHGKTDQDVRSAFGDLYGDPGSATGSESPGTQGGGSIQGGGPEGGDGKVRVEINGKRYRMPRDQIEVFQRENPGIQLKIAE